MNYIWAPGQAKCKIFYKLNFFEKAPLRFTQNPQSWFQFNRQTTSLNAVQAWPKMWEWIIISHCRRLTLIQITNLSIRVVKFYMFAKPVVMVDRRPRRRALQLQGSWWNPSPSGRHHHFRKSTASWWWQPREFSERQSTNTHPWLVYEPTMLNDLSFCIPIRWFTWNGIFFARAWKLEQRTLGNLNDTGWIVREDLEVEVPQDRLLKNFQQLGEDFSGR
jgi:hypothetical protein